MRKTETLFIKRYTMSQIKSLCVIAFTGIAATLLPTGKPVHKVLGLSLALLSDSSSNISVQSK